MGDVGHVVLALLCGLGAAELMIEWDARGDRWAVGLALLLLAACGMFLYSAIFA